MSIKPYCYMGIDKIKSMQSFSVKMNHNYRLEDVPNADPNREHLNEELIKLEHKTYEEAFREKLFRNNHTPRKNAVLGFEVVTAYNSRTAGEDFDLDKWKELNVKWLQDTFGKDNVVSAILHRDEGNGESGHIHAVVIPMHEGKLNAKHYLGGPKELSELQTEYAKAIEETGLIRGIERSVASHESVRRFYTELEREIAKELPPVEKKETAEEYRERANEVFLNANLHHLDEIKQMEREIIEAASKSYRTTVDNIISDYSRLSEIEKREEEIKRAEEKIQEQKRELAKINEKDSETMRKVLNMNLIIEGLKNYPDQEYSHEVGAGINKIIQWQQYEKERANEEKEIEK